MSLLAEIAPPSDPFRTDEGPQGVFRVILDAMARPGTVGRLPALDERAPVDPAKGLAAIAQTLLDHEVTFAVAGGDDRPSAGFSAAVAAYLRSVTGSRDVFPSEADYIFCLGPVPAELPGMLRTGLPAYPDEGATLVSLVPPLDGTAGIAVALSGPGVRPETVATVPGWSLADLASLTAANANPPLGVDVILVDAGGRVMCLPRSTRVSAEHPLGRPVGAPVGTGEAASGLHGG